MERRLTTRLAAVAAASFLGAGVTACDSAENGDSGNSDQTEASDLKVGLAYDVGGRGDKSFNDSAYRGLQKIEEELGVEEVNDLEPSEGESDSDKVDRLSLMAEQGYDIVFGIGFAYAEPMKEVAPDHPDVNFAIVDEEIEGVDNITSLVFADEEAAFLAGAAAAHKTEEDHIGFVGGVETPLIKKFEAGYTAGAEHVAPDIEVETSYISQPPDMSGFQDPALGRSTAKGQLDKGADVLYHGAGAAGTGVLEAVVEADAKFVGTDSDQYENASEEQKPHVVTSALKGVDTAVFEFASSVADGEAQSGVQRFDLADGGVDYATSNTEEISDIEDDLDELKQQIADGEIEVPTKP